MVDRTFFAECEGFDETIRMYLEDVELCWQAHVRGRAVHFVSDARCYHEPGRSSDGKNFASDLALHLTLLAARVEFMRRRSGRLQAGLTRGVIAVGAVLRACAKIAQGRPCHKHLQVLKWAVTDGRAPGWLDGPRIAR